VKRRIGDRRRGARFEIVGTLSGTLETWQRFKLLDLGAGGALLESPTPLLPGSRVNGRVAICGQLRDVRAIVRRVESEGTQQRYRVAIEWGQPLSENDMLLTAHQVPGRRELPRPGADRRRVMRVAPPSPAEIQWPAWATINLLDISTTGVLFTSPIALAPGEKGHLRLRLGDRSFNAEVEIRRGTPDGARGASYKVGASFVTLDEVSRFTLDEFLGDQRS
jgi:hypothetical protein